MTKEIVIALIVSFFCFISLNGMTFDFEVEQPQLRNNEFKTDLPVVLEPGNPMLPYYPLQILLPGGERFIRLEIESGEENLLTDVQIDHARNPQPISLHGIDNTLPNSAVYASDRLFPASEHEVLGVQRKNGHDILIVNVYPYRYNPVRKELLWVGSFSFRVETENDSELTDEQNLYLLQAEQVRKNLADLVINPEELNSYNKTPAATRSILTDLNEPYQMVIISTMSKETVFDEYITWQENRDISTGFFAVEDIYQNYNGIDNQEKIRSFIIDAYQTYAQTDTPLEYIILGGDDQIIPIRGMFGQVGNTVDHNMPADLYYSNLDGNWDANGNGIYGELGDDIDLYAEVALGRIPAFSDSQFQNFFHKSMYYVDNNTYSNDIAYMFGENLDGTPTWGGDYKDQISPYIPDDYHLDTLYERDGTFSIENIVNAFNNGLGIINHIGHANYFIVFGLNNGRINSLQNTEYGFAYTQGCYPAAFDYSTSQESGAVGQNLTIASGGLFAFIGNTRYGWYSPGSTNGASQAFDITFFSGLYEHNIRELGHTLNYSRESLANEAMSHGVMRWIFYELVLFGDPSIAVKDANGTFPYVEPVEVVFDDITGDNDGSVNPGESIQIYLELENLPGWAEANNVTASISFESDLIYLIDDTVYFGYIAPNSSSINSENPFVIEVDPNIPYAQYSMIVDITAEGLNNASFSRSYELTMPVTLTQNHWPWESTYPITASPILADFTGDRMEELVIVDVLGNINLLDANANLIHDPFINQENLWRSFSMGDITNDGNREIVLASRLQNIKAFNYLGDLLFSFEDCGQQILTPVLADINNDGNLQIISLGLNRNLYVLEGNGELSEGFPVSVPQASSADLAVVDLNGNGRKEIIIGTVDGNIYIVQHNGSMIDDFQVSLDSGIITAPLVLDNKKIAVGTSSHKLYLISTSGEILFEKTLPQRIATEVIAGDFRGDGELELAFVTYNGLVGIVDQNGEYLNGWPIHLNQSFMQPPLAVDLNGDEELNLIVASTQGNIYGYNADGSMVDSFPVPLNTTVSSPASIADIDNDGDWDIILATSTGITVLDYKLPKGDMQPWNLYRGNMHRTGFYGDNNMMEIDIPESEYVTTLEQNYPNHFNPSTRINFSLREDSPVVIEIFNIKGQKIRTLVNKDMEAGQHSVLWTGINDRNRAVGAGVYFYRLQTADATITRKMLFLK